jgi:hypothetical protein
MRVTKFHRDELRRRLALPAVVYGPHVVAKLLDDVEELQRALDAARAALSRAPDLIRGRKAWLESASGMGSNIATEDAGRFLSPSKWAEFERLVDEALKEMP